MSGFIILLTILLAAQSLSHHGCLLLLALASLPLPDTPSLIYVAFVWDNDDSAT